MWSDVFCPSYKGYGFWIPFPFFSTKGRAYLMNHMPPITPCLGYGDICHCKNLSDQSIPQSCEVHKSPIFLLTQNSSHHVLSCSYITVGGTRNVNDKMMERKQKAGCSFEDTCSVKIAICIFRRFQQCVPLWTVFLLPSVLEQLHILKPFLPHTLFAQETHDDSNEDLPSTNPLDRPPRQV